MKYQIKDLALSLEGKKSIEWASRNMPVLAQVQSRFEKEKPLKGKKAVACLHVTKETAVLMISLKKAGAEVVLCGSNPLSTQDDVAAGLVDLGIPVFAWKGNHEAYYDCIESALSINKPNLVLDDGADLIHTLHKKHPELIPQIIGGQEETTTGVIRLRAMAKDGALKFPVMAVNDTPTKHFFDNRFGTGQSTLDGILRATDMLFAGKKFVVAGFGFCGKGIAERARGAGAKVVVTEVDPIKALEAHMSGFVVASMEEASAVGDVFVTATGCKDVITGNHFSKMKDGAVVANAGHFNIEINLDDLKKKAQSVRTVRPQVEEYNLSGRRILVLAEGRLVNLACATGHPSEVMDQSFSAQALCTEHLVKNKLTAGVHEVPLSIDRTIARLKLQSLGIQVDILSASQEKYLNEWREGT
ncbi:MAG TPA: adenosylhomocysteinase [Candidatus Norongarragalinales archaeon]|nr:adenosylhomocysteinase [Candidatus Norongarragalinales archaeon]